VKSREAHGKRGKRKASRIEHRTEHSCNPVCPEAKSMVGVIEEKAERLMLRTANCF